MSISTLGWSLFCYFIESSIACTVEHYYSPLQGTEDRQVAEKRYGNDNKSLKDD